jgi:hypothetical protein
MKLQTLLKRLGTFEKVEQIANNQVIIYFKKGKIFQSYNTIMLVEINNQYYIRRDWQISVTTSKYLYEVLWITEDNKKKGLEKRIKSGSLKFFED